VSQNGTLTREEQLRELLKGMLRHDPRGGAQRSHDDRHLVDNLAHSFDKRIADGTLSEANLASDLMMHRVALWRNLKERMGLNYRQLERIVLRE